jgi:hypothetical protein
VADGFRFDIVSDRCLRELQALDKHVDRATAKGLKAVGNYTAREGRKGAPVYKGPPRKVSVGGGKRIHLEPGALKRSIKASRRPRPRGNGVWTLTVGPRGGHVHLYSAKQERRRPYMEPAFRKASLAARDIHAKAWEKVMRSA